MKFSKMCQSLFILIFLMGCLPTDFKESPQTSTIELSPSITPIPLITQIPTATDTPSPLYRVIDEKNIKQLALLYQWDSELLFSNSLAFWFSNSNQFIIPISKASTQGFQSFEFESGNFIPTWFIQTESYEAMVDEYDQVVTYFHGLHIFNQRGEKIQTIETDDNCGENTASHIVAIPRTDLIITGHQDIFSDFGLHGNAEDKSRLVIWDNDKRTCSALLKGFEGRLLSLSASYDGRYISYSFGIRDPESWLWLLVVKIYDLSLQKETCKLNGLYAQFNHQNQLVVYNPQDATISLTKPSDCTPQLKFNTETEIADLALSSNGDLLAGSSPDGTVVIWSLRTGEKIHEIDGQGESSLRVISFSPDGRFFITTRNRISPTEKDKIILWGISQN